MNDLNPYGSRTEDRILKAAIMVFAEKGFRGGTVRDICQRAGAMNLNAVKYYFGGKSGLYKAVLKFMFEDAGKYMPEHEPGDQAVDDPEKALGLFVDTLIRVIYTIDSKMDADLYAVFAKETTSPSPFFDEMVDQYIKPYNLKLDSLIRSILGEETDEETVLYCRCGILGQIYYYMFARPIFDRVNPEHPGIQRSLESLAGHITRFSLGGLRSLRADTGLA